MTATSWDRRDVLKTMSMGGAAVLLGAVPRSAAAQQVKWSEGTEPPKLKGAGQRLRLAPSHLWFAV